MNKIAMARKGFPFLLLVLCYLLETIDHFQLKYEWIICQWGRGSNTIQDLTMFEWYDFLNWKLPMHKKSPISLNSEKTVVKVLLLIISGEEEVNLGPTYMCQICKQVFEESAPCKLSMCVYCIRTT